MDINKSEPDSFMKKEEYDYYGSLSVRKGTGGGGENWTNGRK